MSPLSKEGRGCWLLTGMLSVGIMTDIGVWPPVGFEGVASFAFLLLTP